MAIEQTSGQNLIERLVVRVDGQEYVLVRFNGGCVETYKVEKTGLEMFVDYLAALQDKSLWSALREAWMFVHGF